jgi:flagellar biosynthesis protein
MNHKPYTEAVALEYGRNKTPVVTAKGDDDLAYRMIQEAQKQGVFISEDPLPIKSANGSSSSSSSL